ncbi:MAG: Hsp70 family protein [Pseudonocardiaceae bacterium]
MGYWLGIDLGSTFTAAAVCREENGHRGEDGRWGPPEVVGLGGRSAAVSSVVFLGEGGQVVVGEAAERRAVTDPDRVVRGFKRRIGDEVPMVAGGVAYGAPQIAAMVVRWVVERVAAREGGPAAGIVLTHPAGWGAFKVETLAQALRAADLGQVRFVTEPEAAAAGYAVQERIEPGRTVAVYDLGGGTFDAAVVRKTGTGAFCLLGQPQGLEQLGGVDFDDAVFAHVLAALPALAELDGEDPAVLAASAALRRECTEAKEALSADTEVTIPVLAPGIQSQVRLVRAEFEDMIRHQVGETVQALRRALRSAQLEPAELDVVLLVGGSSRVPLVAQLVSAELGRPVAVDADPKAAIALGAALLAAPTAPDVHPTAEPPDRHDPPAEPDPPTLAPTSLPERPSLTAIPLDVETADPETRRTNARRVKRITFAGALALVTAAAVASVPFLTAHSEPTPPANAGVPPPGAPPAAGAPELATSSPAAANPVPNAGTRSEASPRKAGSSGIVRTTPPAAPSNPAGGGAKPDPAEPSDAPAPDWVTTYTWTTTWSSPPPTTTRGPTPTPTTPAPAPTPSPSPTPSPTPPTTTKPTTTPAPTPTPTAAAPPLTTSSPRPQRPGT